ncbi:hypothetical protein PTKIN_Ptkin13bG0257100 [Pterospermum kingtungense]
MARSSRSRRRSDDSSPSQSESDETDSRDSDDDYSGDDTDGSDRGCSKKKRSSRNITEEEIADYMVKKAQKKAEIEMVKKRRAERAVEKAQLEEEMAMIARECARAEFQDWEKKGEEHLNGSNVMAIELTEPYMVFKGLTVKEMEELRDDIEMHLDLDRASPTLILYWEALPLSSLFILGTYGGLVVCDRELAEAWKKDALDRARVHGEELPTELLAEERGLHSSIEADVKNLLEGKIHCELEVLQSQIESKMRTGMAKVYVKEMHAKTLGKYLQRLEQPSVSEDRPESDHGLRPGEENSDHDVGDLFHGDEDEEAIDPEEDRAILERSRLGVTEKGDAVFGSGAEVNLDSQIYWWHDKYRRRKPKYFNHVHTGYEWNKYYQTHYDHDNPPRKSVQGYKFNISYPDLVDKTKASVYTVEKDGNCLETCIIRFHARPPYEDIAFRIVNKHWEYSHKKGFKCTFERGTLHVYLNFKRHRYRS